MKYFIYCRKSSEDERRQILSIQSQLREVERAFHGKDGIEIAGTFEEERSAMKPGRPVFAEMVRRIEAGEAEGIIAWSPDRLARNSIDGGRIIYLLDCNILRDMKFATYTFENNSQGKFMLQIMFGQSKYYSDALSENVRRGIRTKVENGWWPTSAPLGYRNDRETGTIAVDPVRFPLIRKMLTMMLSGAYGAEQIWTASKSWGLTTPVRHKLGGKPLALSTVYKILYNPFYAGVIPWGGAWHAGKHAPMITIDEHHRIRSMLSRPGRPQPKRHYFAYAGIIICGSCGLSVTAENKKNRYGSNYVYYHCTKRFRPRCGERSVEVEQLEAQFRAFLSRLVIRESIRVWAADRLMKAQLAASEQGDVEDSALDQAITKAERRLSEVADMRSRSLIGDEEYATLRDSAGRELMQLRQSKESRQEKQVRWFEPAQTLISFSNRALSWFEEGTDEEKRLIMLATGSNFSLSNRIVSIQARKSYRCMPRMTNFPAWRGYVKNIRKMVGTSELDTVLNHIKKLEELRIGRLGEAGQLPRSEALAKSGAKRRAGARLPPGRLRG